ncbi:MAG TPA: hypothetical protein VLH75_10150 [Longimicrobiales bacterium]|nr:hypothetical protein [Longimicrobiales bacterium]
MVDIRRIILALTAFATLTPAPADTQATLSSAPAVDPTLYAGMRWRMVGPHRGGRVTAVAGIPGQPHVFLQGTTGGGVWRTDDAGSHWEPIADDFLTAGNVGAIAVAASDPDVIYVGTGSACIRGNISVGRGAWKSEDGGKSWRFVGLPNSGAIGEMAVHPGDPDLVYAAALGSPFGRNPERGVYRSRDGGDTWERVLFLNDSTGAVSLALNPTDPNEIYAGMWRAERKPWTLISGSLEGGIYKSTDGGDTWTKLSGGLPQGLVGRVGLAISPANPRRVWAMVDAEPGNGLWRSDDAGATWTFLTGDDALAGRPWYYHHVVADPRDPEKVYILNVRFHRSTDGGKTFTLVPIPHGDVHALWINPDDTDLMVLGDDGGAVVTLNGARTWSTMYNQPTAELYDLVVDNGWPYRLYGSQQDNTTISVPVRPTRNQLRTQEGWRYAAGCETGPVALHPDHPDIIWGGCYGGVINRMDVSKDTRRNVNLLPEATGVAPGDLRNRFQWVAPILVSPHDPETVFHASQYVHRTRDGGMTWETISPDLSWNDPAVQGFPGGPIRADNTGVEVFGTVFALAVSPRDAKEIWAGTDDGRVWVTRDDGSRWSEVTPRGMPKWATVNRIELSGHAPGRAFLAVQRYRMDDRLPYVWRTDDFGRSWTLLTDGRNGIPEDHWVRVVREDPERRGLLYAGTEFGVFVSFDDGTRWQPLRMNLPATPITDLKVHRGDVVVSTQGRSFWVLDDVGPLRELSADPRVAGPRLFTPRDAGRGTAVPPMSEVDLIVPDPLPDGALVHYVLPDSVPGLSLEIRDAAGRTVQRWGTGERGRELSSGSGYHRVAWDLRYATGGVKAPPGDYAARLSWDGGARERRFRVVPDPLDPDVTQADYDEQFRVSMAVADTQAAVSAAVARIRAVRQQADSLLAWARDGGRDAAQLGELHRALLAPLAELEARLTSTERTDGSAGKRSVAGLDRQYGALLNHLNSGGGYGPGSTEGRPTAGALQRQRDLDAEWSGLAARLAQVEERELAAFNAEVERLGGAGAGPRHNYANNMILAPA